MKRRTRSKTRSNVILLRRRLAPPRKLPAAIQAKLARTTLRAARTAAENGRCGVAEGLLVAGTMRLQAAGRRASTKGAMVRALDAGKEATYTGTAIIECRERERSSASPSGETT